ncbi:MAG: hypothetical protein QOJ15_5963, partial [Bradyrhizobium sp.]|nr:hypothetical protein [Bradyrhizobium sp.]
GLNCRPLHYQWSALPLSYGSMPGYENRPKRAPPRRPILATRPPHAQAHGRPPGRSKCGKNQRGTPAHCFHGLSCGLIRFPVSSPGAASASIGRTMTSNSMISPASRPCAAICRYWRQPIACSPPGIGDCTDGGRNTIYSDNGEASRSWSREAIKRCQTRPLRQSSQCMHFAHRVFAPVIRTGSR